MTVRIAMWSGPRNCSTAMMRAFENRDDCDVSDEPFYAAFLAETGIVHPMNDAVLASQPNDWRDVAAAMTGEAPNGAPIWYQKQMCHHMLPDFGLDWMDSVTNAFLIRPPEQVLASYIVKRGDVTLEDIGVVRQCELFDRVAERTGAAPVVIEGPSVQRDPRESLTILCEALAIPFSDRMLNWPPGRRASDGAWAPAWYDAVEKSTGFAAPSHVATIDDLPEAIKPIAEAARPYYERMAQHRIG
ncbi:sulfotransferase-like domain-containing protein [Stakelama tenebrarum]|uniref:HAD family hydrolase n=1 Tax=Stakelama tenebrarum TaxID=2711215 RepID=A0A6G6Y8A5_9SPHN|nr:HAD family hydrolase [Sphingosinithalassobacter tenebrarum]QIG81150.1 HAD family hydrolase [Sphingosinithalassobacter tenebrarum]